MKTNLDKLRENTENELNEGTFITFNEGRQEGIRETCEAIKKDWDEFDSKEGDKDIIDFWDSIKGDFANK